MTRALKALEDSRGREREDPLSDDQMVEDLRVDEAQGRLQSACERLVSLTRLRGARGMVVVVMCPRLFCDAAVIQR
jgi:hypothetical protein